jgi:hypothetical protein
VVAYWGSCIDDGRSNFVRGGRDSFSFRRTGFISALNRYAVELLIGSGKRRNHALLELSSGYQRNALTFYCIEDIALKMPGRGPAVSVG